MERIRIRLGSDEAWLELTRTDEDYWQIRADWCGRLTADFTAFIHSTEALDFTARMSARLGDPYSGRFSAEVTPGRNNPLRLKAEPLDGEHAFYARLTPNGHDEVCCLQMEIGPAPTDELRAMFDAAHAALAG
ncbi:hypothetical protein ACWDR0_11825 [Streptomyces sp. NPDC003691]